MGRRWKATSMSLLGCNVLAADSGAANLYLRRLRRRRRPEAPALLSNVEPPVVLGRGLKVTAFWMGTIGAIGRTAIGGGSITLSAGSGMDSATSGGFSETGGSTLRAELAAGGVLLLIGMVVAGGGRGGGAKDVKMAVNWISASW